MSPDRPQDMEQARCYVRAVFEELGIDVSTPNARIEAQKDFAFLRSWREASSGMRRFTVRALAFTLITGALGLLWTGFVHLK